MLPSGLVTHSRTASAQGTGSTAVLLSAGLDSAVLAAAEARRGRVHPVYISVGLAWEAAELAALARLLDTPPYASLAPLAHLTFPAQDLYPATHWAIVGTPPAFDTPDEDVYLTGRNVMLLSKVGIHCAQMGMGRIVIGPLAGNPFPDATPDFFASMSRTLSLGLGHAVAIDAPFAAMHKGDVIRLGLELGVPLEMTLSCMNPRQGRHCGQCSKCRERRDAFLEIGTDDPTVYLSRPLR
jgi:7-cyano-7-deazaguanine synthase